MLEGKRGWEKERNEERKKMRTLDFSHNFNERGAWLE